METNIDFPLPHEWNELELILADMKACRESGDVEGYNKCAERLIAWRDMYPDMIVRLISIGAEKHRCRTCNKLTRWHTQCNNCWEVETRISEYMMSKKGRQLVRDILDEYDDYEVIGHG